MSQIEGADDIAVSYELPFKVIMSFPRLVDATEDRFWMVEKVGERGSGHAEEKQRSCITAHSTAKRTYVKNSTRP